VEEARGERYGVQCPAEAGVPAVKFAGELVIEDAGATWRCGTFSQAELTAELVTAVSTSQRRCPGVFIHLQRPPSVSSASVRVLGRGLSGWLAVAGEFGQADRGGLRRDLNPSWVPLTRDADTYQQVEGMLVDPLVALTYHGPVDIPGDD
jgi:hypothetical protein